MPPNQPKKPVKKPKFAYSHEQLLRALEAYKNGENAFQVSKKYGVPRSTLIGKASGKLPLNEERKLGPAPKLGFEAENMLKNWVMGLANRGFPITKKDLITSVHQILRDMNAIDMFPGGRPGETWLKLFLKRNPQIAERTVEKLSKVRAVITEESVRSWFSEVRCYLEENNLFQGMADPSRVYNMDESAFFLCPKSDRVLGIKGQKNVYEVSTTSDKENLTVLANVNAAGQVAPTLIVYPGQRLPQALKLNMPDDWIIAKSESGWITGEVYYEYFVNYFYKWLIDSKIQFPVIVFVDGHKSHITYHLSKFCSDKNIVLVALLPNCTHVLQPLDVAVFRPVKKGWQEAVHSWRMVNGAERLTKYNFAPMLKTVFDKTMVKDTIKNGFIRCGLCPFDEEAVDFSKIDILNNMPGKETTPVSNQLHQNNPKPSHHTEGKECLTFFESFISPATLLSFQATYNQFTPIWNGDESSQDLYVVWKKMKDHLRSKEKNRPKLRNKSNSLADIDNDSDEIDQPMPLGTAEDPTDLDQHVNLPVVTEEQDNLSLQLEIQTPFIDNESVIEPSSSTSSKEQLAKVLSPNTGGAGVPSPFKNNLLWPGTPPKSKKKSRTSNIKLPSVVSSKEWQYYEEKKRVEKKQEEDRKAEKRKLREDKKMNKSTGNQKKSKGCRRKLVEDEDEDWTCKVCLKRYSAELIVGLGKKWINCDNCKCAYHYKCIPKKHRDTYGIEDDDEEDDELAFMCHNCVSDSDDDPLELSDLEDDMN